MTDDSEELILKIVQSLDERVDDLQKGQTEILKQLATHEERSVNQARRISVVERAGGAIGLALMVGLISIVLSGCGLISALTTPPAAPTQSAPKIDVVARAVKNTVSIQTTDGFRFCSGIAAEGMIITAEHCVEGDDAFEVVYKGQAFPGFVVSTSEKHDLAFVDAIGARLQDTVPLADKEPVLGNKVVWMGYPAGLDFIMGTGIVGNPSVILEGQPDVDWLAIYGQFIPGNSGGPVFNSRGKLIGIVASTMSWPYGILPVGYAVPLHTLKAAL